MGAKYCDERVCVSVCPLACLNKSSAVAEMGDRGHNRHEPKRGGGAAVPLWGDPGPHLVNVAWAEFYFRTN